MLDDESTSPRPVPTPLSEHPSDADQAVQRQAPAPVADIPTVVPPATGDAPDDDASPAISRDDDPAATISVPSIPSQEPESTPARTAQSAAPILPPMQIEDLVHLRIASDPQLSPAGDLVAFTIQQNYPEHNTDGSSIWLVSSAGGKTSTTRQLTDGRHHDTMPRWSPDGRTLAFLSDRSGTTQLYLLPMNGGEARQFSTLTRDISEYSWHPAGTMLLAHSPWKPSDNQEKPDDAEIHVHHRLDDRWDGTGYKQGCYQQLWLLPLTGNAVRLTSEPVDLTQSCWSPDGAEIAFCANRRPDPDLSVSMAVWVLTTTSGQMRRLTPEEGLAQRPAWSPDGQRIAYLYAPDQTEAGNISPWIVDAHGPANPQPAIPGAEDLTCQAWIIDELRSEWLHPPLWYPDGKALLVPVQERGHVHLYRLDTVLGTHMWLTSGNGRYVSPHISRNGRMITAVRVDWFTPGDIWCMDGDGRNPRKLTRINDSVLQRHQLVRPKLITWQSFDGETIEGWLYLPTQAQQTRVPLIVAPHGGPSLAWGESYVHEFQVLAGRGYAVLAPNPRGSAGYGEAFSRSVLNDWGGDDLRDLLAGLDHVIASELVDAQRLGIGGLSYGGYMTNRAISQTNRFKAAVSRNGISDITSALALSDQTIWFTLSMNDEAGRTSRSALTFVDQIETPLLLLHAENDLRCPFSQAQQLFVALRKRRRTVELVSYPNTSHLMDWPGTGTPRQRLDRLSRTVAWFERFL